MSTLGCSPGAKLPDDSAAGTYQSSKLGVAIEFPPGWMHRAAGDTSRTEGGIRERGSQFYIGDVNSPDVALSLKLSDPVKGLPPYSQMSEFVMLKSSRGGARRVASMHGLTAIDCEVVYLSGRMTGRCVGSFGQSVERLRVYFFAVEEFLASAVFFHDAEYPAATMDTIAASVR